MTSTGGVIIGIALKLLDLEDVKLGSFPARAGARAAARRARQLL
jgi:hypothetical protein